MVKNLLKGLSFSCLLMLITCFAGFAEGSKELSSNGGSRAFLVSGTTSTASFVFPTNGTMKVYAKAGEVINVGSSVQGVGSGTINLRAPNGSTFTSGTSTTIGLIANRTQEVAGPAPNANGYTPYTHTVTAAEAGVWEIDFIALNNGQVSVENPSPVAAGANWTQPNGQYIAAFDVSVRNTANTAFLTGRVFTNIFSGILGAYDVGFNGVFTVLTRDGYMYTLDNNGQAGNGFSFFVNNKGFRQSDNTASYKSVNSLNPTPNIQDPRSADSPTDVTYKLFFNSPAADLPATANMPGGTTTWLLSAVVDPTLTGYTFTGTEGTPGIGGTAPLGGVLSFTTNKNGTYSIIIDVNKNGVFGDGPDRTLTGNILSGQTNVGWDGLDGLNNKVVAGSYASSLNAVLFGGEVHFPFFDVERNINGIKLTRTNGALSPDFTVYWDDSQITSVGTPSFPLVNTFGINSQVNGHKWGSPGSGPVEFGDEKGMDTWSFIAATPLVANAGFILQEADLKIAPFTSSAGTNACAGQQISYVVAVTNAGPNNVTGSKFNFTFPAALTGVTVSSVPTTGTSAVNNGTLAAAAYTASIDLASGATRTFTVTGNIGAAAAGSSVSVTASILRTADMTDPDATNPDAAAPADATNECNSAPSGPGCNNIQSSVTTFLSPPNAGADQAVDQNQTVTLTDTNPGTWSQIGIAPVAVVIAAPAALSTTVTGFTDPGIYQFLRTNAAGCTDTVNVTVVPKSLDIPTVITPNGDGKNDVFTIPNIQLFPGSQLIIFNRWGNEVFHSNDYQNNWTGAGLSEGTYYYMLNKKEPTGSFTPYKGWLFLRR